MAILKVARMGHPVLRTRGRALDRGEIKGATIQKLIDDMIETMVEYHGVGLAAPQIHEKFRVFVAILNENTDGEPAVELKAHYFSARVIQHETDHLDGILFFDRMQSFGSLTFLDEYSRYWAKDRD